MLAPRGDAGVLLPAGDIDRLGLLVLAAEAELPGEAVTPAVGLAAGGEAGVARSLRIFVDEIDRVQALIGCPNLEDIGRSFLVDPPAAWPANR